MNRYIFLTNCISGVGGSQLYISRKIEWLQSIGWEVDVFFFESGEILIENLKSYKDNIVPQLMLPLGIVSDKEKKTIIRKISKNGCAETIMESHLQPICLWGEYITSIIGGMNICYLLSEGFLPMTKEEIQFFDCKRKMNLLFGITSTSIPRLMGTKGSDESTYLNAVGCSIGNVADIEYSLVHEIKEGKTIVCIGRLEKPFVPSMVNSVLLFANRHLDDSFNVILIGDSEVSGIKDSVIEKLDKADNITVYCTGFMNPISRQLLKKADVAISSAGSVLVTFREKILTISVDSTDFKAIGIYGITTKNALSRNQEPVIEIDELLEEVLYDKKYDIKDIVVNPPKLDYSKHLRIIEKYNPNHICTFNWELSNKQKFLRVLYSILGCSKYIIISKKIGKIKTTIKKIVHR